MQITDDQPSEASFQARVHEWLSACLGVETTADLVERRHRFLEEALELVQASGGRREEVLPLVDYVYGRPPGEIGQEVGGVMVTLASLCTASHLDMSQSGETELAHAWTKIDKIRAKRATKPMISVEGSGAS